MTNTRWWLYLERLMGDDNAMTAARRAGISSSNFTRWKKGAKADPEFVVKIARSYGANVLEALVEAEFITEQEAQLRDVAPTLRESLASMTARQIADEVARRLSEAESLLADQVAAVRYVQSQQQARPDIEWKATDSGRLDRPRQSQQQSQRSDDTETLADLTDWSALDNSPSNRVIRSQQDDDIAGGQ